MRQNQFIGASLTKFDAKDKVTGKATYCGDLKRPDMLYGAARRSEYAHARLLSIDITQASAMPGVKAIITAADIPGKNRVGMTGVKDTPVLAEEYVCFYQQAVAVVAADSPAAAKAAAAAITVQWEPLPVINSIEEAMKPDAICLHGQAGNIGCVKLTECGDVEKALAAAAVIIKRTYTTHMVEHAYIEPEAVLAEPYSPPSKTGPPVGVLVWSSTKSVHMDQAEICRVTGLPPALVHVKAPYIGGSFGGKSDLPINCMAALLCLKTGRPVSMVYSREESMQVSSKRHPMILEYTHGADRDGRLVAVKAEIRGDCGAYAGYSVSVLTRTVLHGAGPYFVPNVQIRATVYFTNNPAAGAMRGFGVPQVAMAHERQMDLLAAELGMDPFAIRILNGLRAGDTLPSGQITPVGSGYVAAVEKAQQIVSQEDTAAPLKHDEAWGIAGHYYGNGRTAAPNPGTAALTLLPEGRIQVAVGSPDIGQGSNMVMAQIAASVLATPLRYIEILSADSRDTLDSGTTSGTRLTAVVGRGVQDTAAQFLALLKNEAALCLEQKAEDIDLTEKDGRLWAVGQGGEISLPDLYQACYRQGRPLSCTGRYDPPTTPLDEKCQGIPYPSYTFGVQCIKVKVDKDTGQVFPQKVIAVYDVGTPLNPLLLEGQMEGGVAGGLGYGLFEEIKLEEGKITNPNFDGYLLPTTMDLCPIASYFVPTKDGEGPFGAKGVGEPALIPTAAALANGVSRQLGKEFNHLPLSLEAVQIRNG